MKPQRPFYACETGKGWDGCKSFCHADASLSCQADALADTTTLAAYAEWMKGFLTPLPDGCYELTSFALDEDTQTFQPDLRVISWKIDPIANRKDVIVRGSACAIRPDPVVQFQP
ncbi:hypothetical protein [uncultured Roseobacter sp.]|uniref:hypothetical protein n=1 Tax=uncultured Roseobacter sp. TaxID=114847 RepID=UPI0026185273|nr:hypothetical protein [uncultured Roseobacter sp.]